MKHKLQYFFAIIFLAFALQSFSQQQVFSRDNVTTGNWGDGQVPWYYQISNNYGRRKSI